MPPDNSGAPLHLAIALFQRCQLNCRYCYHVPAVFRDIVTPAAAGDILLFIDAMVQQSGRKLSVFFTGYEPLLQFERLRKVADRLVEGYRDRLLTLALATNGAALSSETASYLVARRFKVTLSCDGLRYVHDRNRPSRSADRRTYGRVLRALRLLLHNGVTPHVRLTYMPDTIPYVTAGIKSLYRAGARRFGLAAALDHGDWSNLAINRLRSELELLINWYDETRKVDTSLYIAGLAPSRRRNGNGWLCPAADGLLAISSDGLLYLCWRFIGERRWLIGVPGETLS